MSSECKSEGAWKPFITTSIRNVVTNSLVTESTLWMVKDCACKKCAKVNKRKPTPEEDLRHGRLVDESKRKSVALPTANSANRL